MTKSRGVQCYQIEGVYVKPSYINCIILVIACIYVMYYIMYI